MITKEIISDVGLHSWWTN